MANIKPVNENLFDDIFAQTVEDMKGLGTYRQEFSLAITTLSGNARPISNPHGTVLFHRLQSRGGIHQQGGGDQHQKDGVVCGD